MDKINIDKIKLVQTNGRDKLYKTNYLIKSDIDIKYKIKNVYLPFGYEDFNKHTILNFEISPLKFNEHYNFKLILTDFETKLKNTIIINDTSN